MLGTVGLRDAPVRLSADQLTSFTALRLIAMRVSFAGLNYTLLPLRRPTD